MSDDDQNDDDITRIEDLSDFLHEETEVDTTIPEETDSDDQNDIEEFEDLSIENVPEFTTDNEFTSTFSELESSDTQDDIEGINSPPPMVEQEDEFSEESPAAEEIQFSDSTDEIDTETAPLFTEEIEDTIGQDENQANNNYQAPEDFSDIKKFAESASYVSNGQEGTPPYSILLKNIKYTQDAELLLEILTEFRLVDEEDIEQTKKTISRGSYLISRVSEFVAIKLIEKLRKLDLSYQSGLTELINPPTSYESQDAGLSSKQSIFGNKDNSYIMNRSPLELDQIMVSTMSTINGHEIMKYIAIATENTTVDPDLLKTNSHQIIHDLIESMPEDQKNEQYDRQIARENINASKSEVIFEPFTPDTDSDNEETSDRLDDIYQQLLTKLKAKALELQGNAVIGINFYILPLPHEDFRTLYQVSCTGNVVWVSKH